MMGQLPPDQNALFYDFCLENYVPQDHLLRQIDPFLDLSDLRNYLASYYSPIGRPSVDPELMIRMLIVGYCYGIRSERRLCEEVHLNLAYRWFNRLILRPVIPPHRVVRRSMPTQPTTWPTLITGSSWMSNRAQPIGRRRRRPPRP